MNTWKKEKLDTLSKAVANLYELNLATSETMSHRKVSRVLAQMMKDDHDTKVSEEWVSKVYYRGVDGLVGASWVTVNSFIEVMNDPRLTGRVTEKR